LADPFTTGFRKLLKRHASAASLLCVAFCSSLGSVAHTQTPSAPDGGIAVAPPAHRALDDLAHEIHEWQMLQFPENATVEGDHRYDDQVTDLSEAAIARRRAQHGLWKKRLESIDSTGLSVEDHLSYEILKRQFDDQLAEDRLLPAAFSADDRPIQVTQSDNPATSIVQLAEATRFSSRLDYQNYLSRLQKLPAQLDQTVALLRLAIGSGWVAPRAAVLSVPSRFGAVLDTRPDRNPALQPFARMPDSISPEEQGRMREQAFALWKHDVIPAFERLQAFYRDVYLPKTRLDPSIASLPGGDAYYRLMLRESTTTELSPDEIHALGLKEVARIDQEMDRVRRESGFHGSRAAFDHWLNTDPRFQYKNADELLNAYRAGAKRIDAELPKLFAVLPRLPYGIRLMQPEEGENSEYYTGGAKDGSRAGFVNVNANNLKTHPRWQMETLELHEGMPGHHLQISRALELTDLPEFRRTYWNDAYGEGWALYAEKLGYEIGFYKDPYMNYGHLSDEMLRASRLVVDTGLHAFHMSREDAISYMHRYTAMPLAEVESEVDRYTVAPGQATAYKVGELDILMLRDKAQSTLGKDFDERRFHNALIDHGALPLDLLNQIIDRWIAGQAESRRALPAQ
jgi:uncharacterized protein (DUF885 family)